MSIGASFESAMHRRSSENSSTSIGCSVSVSLPWYKSQICLTLDSMKTIRSRANLSIYLCSLAVSIDGPYAVTIWPGTSAYHIDNNNINDLDYFPRWNGSFYQNQLNAIMDLTPQSYFVLVAMWDEYNEGEYITFHDALS
jgi:hypothetical protein